MWKSFLVISLACISFVYSDTKYVVQIDAGSSGSRVFLYSYDDSATTAWKIPTTQESWSHKDDKGMGKRLKTDGTADAQNIKDALTALCTFAANTLKNASAGAVTPSNVPIYLGGTAGFRALKDDLRTSITGLLSTNIQDSSVCPFMSSSSSVRVLTGAEEGVYGWLAVQVAKQTLDSASTGSLDMGGQSMEVTFQDPTSSTTFGGNGKVYNVFSHSFDDLGQDAVRKKLDENLVAASTANVGPIQDSCRAAGYYENSTTYPKCVVCKSKNVAFIGTGNFDDCRTRMKSLLQKGTDCGSASTPGSVCIEGVKIPAHTGMSFVGDSAFAFMARDLNDPTATGGSTSAAVTANDETDDNDDSGDQDDADVDIDPEDGGVNPTPSAVQQNGPNGAAMSFKRHHHRRHRARLMQRNRRHAHAHHRFRRTHVRTLPYRTEMTPADIKALAQKACTTPFAQLGTVFPNTNEMIHKDNMNQPRSFFYGNIFCLQAVWPYTILVDGFEFTDTTTVSLWVDDPISKMELSWATGAVVAEINNLDFNPTSASTAVTAATGPATGGATATTGGSNTGTTTATTGGVTPTGGTNTVGNTGGNTVDSNPPPSSTADANPGFRRKHRPQKHRRHH